MAAASRIQMEEVGQVDPLEELGQLIDRHAVEPFLEHAEQGADDAEPDRDGQLSPRRALRTRRPYLRETLFDVTLPHPDSPPS